MSLTVGILAHDSEQVLPDLLESVPDALAGVDGWRLVVVDGASTDGTVELVRRISSTVALPVTLLHDLWQRLR